MKQDRLLHWGTKLIGERSIETEWMEEAACAGSDLEFVPSEEGRLSHIETNARREVCAGCPVARECLEYAFEQTSSLDYGVYGGTTGDQRRKLKKYPNRVQILQAWFEWWCADPSIPALAFMKDAS